MEKVILDGLHFFLSEAVLVCEISGQRAGQPLQLLTKA